jgi:hypothetical protein
MIFSLQNKRISVRTQRFRLDPDGQLFDMAADPGQTRNVAQDHPILAGALKKSAADFMAEVASNIGKDDRPYPVGHTKLTYLPARDGEGHGGVQRSNRAPNASYFTNWKTTEDTITWDIDVARAGAYELALHYTAPAAGSRIEVSFQGVRLEAAVAPAYDPPLYGRKEDRHDRGQESYAKDFKPLRLGTMKLPAGRGLLTLRALKVAGPQVADVRYVTLTRA